MDDGRYHVVEQGKWTASRLTIHIYWEPHFRLASSPPVSAKHVKARVEGIVKTRGPGAAEEGDAGTLAEQTASMQPTDGLDMLHDFTLPLCKLLMSRRQPVNTSSVTKFVASPSMARSTIKTNSYSCI